MANIEKPISYEHIVVSGWKLRSMYNTVRWVTGLQGISKSLHAGFSYALERSLDEHGDQYLLLLLACQYGPKCDPLSLFFILFNLPVEIQISFCFAVW